MKKLKLMLISIICLCLIPNMVLAASGSVSVSGSSQVVVGNKVTFTVTLSSSTSIGSWQMQLNYDKKYLQLTSATSEGGGVRMADSSSSGIKSKKYTFTFKTLKTGSTTVSVGSYLAYAFSDMSEIKLTSSSKTIKIITQQQLEASYSKDNNLKSLSIDGVELTPAFNKDTLNYSVTVPEGTKSVNIKAVASDSKASVSGDGEINVSEGANNVSVVVRAENGSEKTYTITVNVIDQNPIEVTIDATKYTVIKLRDNYNCPTLFEEKDITINNITIPACYNEKINYTLVGLKTTDGSVLNAIYNNGTYTKYEEEIGTSLKVIVMDYKNEIEGLIKSKVVIDDKEYTGFKMDENSKNFIVYGVNVETGKKDFYIYDTINKTFATYEENGKLKELLHLTKVYVCIIIAFGVSLFLSLICMISLCRKKNKKKKIKESSEFASILDDDNKVEEKEIKNEEVKEEKIEEEEENILEDKPQKKRKKKSKTEEKEDE